MPPGAGPTFQDVIELQRQTNDRLDKFRDDIFQAIDALGEKFAEQKKCCDEKFTANAVEHEGFRGSIRYYMTGVGIAAGIAGTIAGTLLSSFLF